MDEAGGSDELVGRVPSEVEASDRAADIQRYRPNVNASQRSDEVRIVEVDLDPAQLGQLSDLPQYDRCDAPRLTGQELMLAPG
jgi:hypothetical protein